MEVSSFLQHCRSIAPSHRSLLHLSTRFSASCSLKPKLPTHRTMNKTTRISAKPVPARDRVIQFGKHKGKMLGSLPPSYLNWVSEKLSNFEEWGKLADNVLNDPVYRDRIEWELAQKLLGGDVVYRGSHRSGGAASDLLEISKRFGWDIDDKFGWSKVDFELLGTSKGGRIPRISGEGVVLGPKKSKASDAAEERDGDRRKERRERLRMKRDGGVGLEMGLKEESKLDSDYVNVMLGRNQNRGTEDRSRFPGRESFLKKVVGDRKRWS